MQPNVPPLKRTRIPQEAKSLPTPTNGTQIPTPPNAPTFLDTIDDFSDYVDFSVKADQIAHGEHPTGKGMSQKNCRFCH